MTNEFEVLGTEELALVVAGLNAHGALRERLGLCGCGVLPDPLHVH